MNSEEVSKPKTEKLIDISRAVKEGNQKIFELGKASFDTKIYFEGEVKKLEDKLKKLEEKEEENQKNAEGNQIRLIEALGIFVALFTFISIDIQILKSDLNLLALVGFVLITLGALSFFVTCLNLLVIKSDVKIIDYKFIINFLLTLFFLITGIWLVNKNNKNTYIIFDREQFNKEYIGLLNKNSTDLQFFKECLKSGEWKKCF